MNRQVNYIREYLSNIKINNKQKNTTTQHRIQSTYRPTMSEDSHQYSKHKNNPTNRSRGPNKNIPTLNLNSHELDRSYAQKIYRNNTGPAINGYKTLKYETGL